MYWTVPEHRHGEMSGSSSLAGMWQILQKGRQSSGHGGTAGSSAAAGSMSCSLQAASSAAAALTAVAQTCTSDWPASSMGRKTHHSESLGSCG